MADILENNKLVDMEKKLDREHNGHAYVDMGLSVMWATCNVGASSPQEDGNDYAWGEIETKSRYDQDNCATWWEDIDDIAGTNLDVAHVKWGGKWRMPTEAEYEELINKDNCEWTSTTVNGVYVHKVTSKKTGNSIFLPTGFEWCSTAGDNIKCALGLSFTFGGRPYVNSNSRDEGHPVRPVANLFSSSVIAHDNEQAVKTIFLRTKSPSPSSSVPIISGSINGHDYVDLGLSVKWATCNVGASSPEDYGDYYAWGETETQSRYGTYNCEAWDREMPPIEGTSRDVAHVKWGGSWRMPTVYELEELWNPDNCKWVWTIHNGVRGYRVTSRKNGNSIFLPAAGRHYEEELYSIGAGFYWSSTPYHDPPWSDRDIQDGLAEALEFGHKSCYIVLFARCEGLSVRPVIK